MGVSYFIDLVFEFYLIHCYCIYFTYIVRDVGFLAIEDCLTSDDVIITSLGVILIDTQGFLC